MLKITQTLLLLLEILLKLTEELDGVFSGYDELNKTYDKTTWQFEKNDDGTIKKMIH